MNTTLNDMDEDMLEKLLEREPTQKTRLLYLLIREDEVSESLAWEYDINNLNCLVTYLRKLGWTIRNVRPFTYQLVE